MAERNLAIQTTASVSKHENNLSKLKEIRRKKKFRMEPSKINVFDDRLMQEQSSILQLDSNFESIHKPAL